MNNLTNDKELGLSLIEFESLQGKHSYPTQDSVCMDLLLSGRISASGKTVKKDDESKHRFFNGTNRTFYITEKRTFFFAHRVTACSKAEAIKKILDGDYIPDEFEDFSGEGNFEIEGDGIVCISDFDFHLPVAPANTQIAHLKTRWPEERQNAKIDKTPSDKTFYVTLKHASYSGIKIIASTEDEAITKYLNIEYTNENMCFFDTDHESDEIFYVSEKGPFDSCLPPNATCHRAAEPEAPFMPFSILELVYYGNNLQGD